MELTAEALRLTLNKDPRLIVAEQVRALYGRLYPFMVAPPPVGYADFFTSADLLVAFGAILQELTTIKLALQAHTHPSIGTPPVLPPLPVNIAVLPTPKFGLAQIVPPGVADPLGSSALLSARALTLPATPPIDPTIL